MGNWGAPVNRSSGELLGFVHSYPHIRTRHRVFILLKKLCVIVNIIDRSIYSICRIFNELEEEDLRPFFGNFSNPNIFSSRFFWFLMTIKDLDFLVTTDPSSTILTNYFFSKEI